MIKFVNFNSQMRLNFNRFSLIKLTCHASQAWSPQTELEKSYGYAVLPVRNEKGQEKGFMSTHYIKYPKL